MHFLFQIRPQFTSGCELDLGVVTDGVELWVVVTVLDGVEVVEVRAGFVSVASGGFTPPSVDICDSL